MNREAVVQTEVLGVSARREHVAIVDRATERALLAGVKRIETRFYRNRRLPWGCIGSGDRLHFKRSGGGLIGSARIQAVRHFSGLKPSDINALQARFGDAVSAPGPYWMAKRECRFGVLIWFDRLRPPAVGVVVPRQYGSAWVILPAASGSR